MQYRFLGTTGLKVSALGLGANNFGRVLSQKDSTPVILHAVDAGINFIDSANVYGVGQSEEYLGHALAGRRHQVVLATKAGNPMGPAPNQSGLSRGHLFDSVHASLRRFRTDYLDLYYAHRPDPQTPLEETLRAFDDLVGQGKIRYVGLSNYAGHVLAEAALLAKFRGYAPPVVVQTGYNLLDRSVEAEVIPCCQRHGIGFVPYFPLASGLLTGKYRYGEPPPPDSRAATKLPYAPKLEEKPLAKVAKLDAWARDHGHTVAELAIAWLLAKPMVCSVIAGATKNEQIDANVKALDWQLGEVEINEVEALLVD
ncbi:MAG: aldo/keto reductase [Chloroflexi bacterium]|nr:aldo/keto reductase [Chloroflexota bacterium]